MNAPLSLQPQTRRFLFLLLFLMICMVVGASLALADWSQQAKFSANPAAVNDFAGFAVAISGDTAVLGAPRCHPANLEMCIGDGVGAAYVYLRSGSGWDNTAPVARLTPSDIPHDDFFFGNAVAVDGDTIVVGARYADSNGNEKQGAVYLFVRPGGGWSDMTETARLIASDGVANDNFGHSVAISGDKIAVGSHLSDVAGNSDQGAVYVFEKPVAGWAAASVQTAKLIAGDGVANDRLGQSVGISGNSVVAGAWLATVNGNTTRGAAYVFERSAVGWPVGGHTAKLIAGDGSTNDQFGGAAAISGDTIVVGAAFDAIGANMRQGSAYLYVKPAGGWADSAETVKLIASDGADGDWLGRFVAVSGDTAVVGSPFDDDMGNNSGSIYVYRQPAIGWTGPLMVESQKFTAGDGGSPDRFGFSTAVAGGVIMAGAPQHDLSGNNTFEGAAYVFPAHFSSRISGNWHTSATWVSNAVPGSDNDVFVSAGHTVTVDADAQARRLVVEPGALLIIPEGVTLAVVETVSNQGTIQQTQTVANGRVSLPFIQSSVHITGYVGVTLDTPHNLGSVTARVRGLNPGDYCTGDGAISPPYARRCFEITVANDNPAVVRLWALTGEQNNIPESSLVVYRYAGGAWQQLTVDTASGNDGGAYIYAEAQTPAFSHFLLGDMAFSPTAVTLQNISAAAAVPDIANILLLLLAVLTLGFRFAYRSSRAQPPHPGS